MHFHELRFWKFAKGWWWRMGMLLENSTRTSRALVVQSPTTLIGELECFSVLSVFQHKPGCLPWTEGEGNFFGAPTTQRRAEGLADGWACLGTGGFPREGCRTKHRKACSTEDSKCGRCPSSQFLSISHFTFNSCSYKTPTMLFRQLVV